MTVTIVYYNTSGRGDSVPIVKNCFHNFFYIFSRKIKECVVTAICAHEPVHKEQIEKSTSFRRICGTIEKKLIPCGKNKYKRGVNCNLPF